MSQSELDRSVEVRTSGEVYADHCDYMNRYIALPQSTPSKRFNAVSAKEHHMRIVHAHAEHTFLTELAPDGPAKAQLLILSDTYA